MKQDTAGLPHNLNAERGVIGTALRNARVIDDVKGIVDDVDFFLEKHRRIWGRMVAIYAAGQPLDPLILEDSFRREGALEEVGAGGYIPNLVDSYWGMENVATWAAIIRRDSQRRTTIRALQSWTERLHDANGDHSAEMAELGKVIAQIAQNTAPITTESTHQIASGAYADVVAEIDKVNSGWSTGIPSLDASWGGLQPKKVYQVYGRTKMGKSCVGSSIAANLGYAGTPVVMWTGEMSKRRYLTRMAAGQARVNLRSLKTRLGVGKRPMEEWEVDQGLDKLRRELQTMGAWHHVLLLDNRRMTPEMLESAARAHFTTHGPGVVIADYLQKLSAATPQKSREHEIREISKGLVTMAFNLDCAVLSFGQLNRGGFQRTDPRPQQDDIREGDAPIFDADVFCFFHRPVYFKARKDGVTESQLPGHREAEMIVTANRDGEMGVIPLGFWGEYTLVGERDGGRNRDRYDED